jgi:hypothetical protein
LTVCVYIFPYRTDASHYALFVHSLEEEVNHGLTGTMIAGENVMEEEFVDFAIHVSLNALDCFAAIFVNVVSYVF